MIIKQAFLIIRLAFSVDAFDFRRLIRRRQSIDQIVQIPVVNVVDAVARIVNAVVGNAALRIIVGANPFGAVAGADLRFLFLAQFIFLLLQLHIVKFRLQNLKSFVFIFQLALFILATDDDPRGLVG